MASDYVWLSQWCLQAQTLLEFKWVLGNKQPNIFLKENVPQNCDICVAVLVQEMNVCHSNIYAQELLLYEMQMKSQNRRYANGVI